MMLLIGYWDPAADKNSALAQAYEYYVARLSAQYNFAQVYGLQLGLLYEITTFMVQNHDYCMVC